jgi:hypothetical protein
MKISDFFCFLSKWKIKDNDRNKKIWKYAERTVIIGWSLASLCIQLVDEHKVYI